MDRTHRRLAEIGLRAAERYGFALAGGYAVQAHGIIERPSEDVDLFTGWDRRDEFATALGAIVAAYQESGFDIAIDQQYETFARLRVVDPSDPGQPRVDDVAAGKMSALYTRAEPRDFLDVDAITTSRSHTRKRLCELAEQADGGFDRRMFAEVLGMLERYPDRRFAVYGATPEQITGMRARFKHWRVELLATPEQ